MRGAGVGEMDDGTIPDVDGVAWDTPVVTIGASDASDSIVDGIDEYGVSVTDGITVVLSGTVVRVCVVVGDRVIDRVVKCVVVVVVVTVIVVDVVEVTGVVEGDAEEEHMVGGDISCSFRIIVTIHKVPG